jgi:hypothetical protein
METVKQTPRPYGKVLSGHTIPYGTLADAPVALRSAYYYHWYKDDDMMPELPQPPSEYVANETPDDILYRKELANSVREVLFSLPPRMAKVLCLRFGVGLTQDYTLEEVGVRFDVSRERIRQIEAKALRYLKHPQRIDKLRQALNPKTTEEVKQEIAKYSDRKKWVDFRNLTDYQEKQAKVKKERDEVKAMLGDTAWVEHLKQTDPQMYASFITMVKDVMERYEQFFG